MSTTTWYIIINPHAGSGKTMDMWSDAQTKLDSLGLDYTTVLTNHKAHATKLAYDAAAAGFRRFLAVGGDGSVHEVLNGIMYWCNDNGCNPEDFILGVAPIGSGNDWIKSLGIPHDISGILDMMAAEKFGRQDLVKLTFDGGRDIYMANIAGYGIDSLVCDNVNLQKDAGKRSKMIYLTALLKALRSLKTLHLQVIADGKEVFNGPCISVDMGTGRYSGGGMCQVPKAVIDDGLLDVLVIPNLSMTKILSMLPRLFNGKLDQCDCLQMFQCKTLDIVPLDAESRIIMEVDGEIEGKAPVCISVTGRQIGVIR